MKKTHTPEKNKGNRKNRVQNLETININAAGIDIGSREHYVAVPPDRDPEPVRHFGCLTPDLHDMARWLKSCGIDTVAMESTGVYWIPVLNVLENYGFDVTLVRADSVRNVPGRKSDVQDCQWIQQLHSYGLLAGSFQPDKEMIVLRGYWRHRAGLVEACAKQIHLMHKSLEQMNIQIHKVLSDITGITGMRILRAIIAGERNPLVLARMKHPLVKSSDETIAEALAGEYREDHLFSLIQSVELYDIYQEKIAACDEKIEAYIKTFEDRADPVDIKPGEKKMKRRKNQLSFDARKELFRMTGVDLTHIDGIDTLTAFTVISHCGIDMNQFPTEKHFASWLRLSPNNRSSGGKVLKSKTLKTANKVSTSLRVAAQTLHSSKSALGAYYRRMRMRLGASKAITATAHKLALLIYRMLKYGKDFVDQGQDYYEQMYHERVVNNLKKRANDMGYVLVPLES